jgi:hypothetical protein
METPIRRNRTQVGSYSLSHATKRAVDEAAKREGMSKSGFVQVAIRRHVRELHPDLLVNETGD